MVVYLLETQKKALKKISTHFLKLDEKVIKNVPISRYYDGVSIENAMFRVLFSEKYFNKNAEKHKDDNGNVDWCFITSNLIGLSWNKNYSGSDSADTYRYLFEDPSTFKQSGERILEFLQKNQD